MSTVIDALVAACKDRSCAPPPVGTGGSKPSGGGKPAGAGEAASGAEAFRVSTASYPGNKDLTLEGIRYDVEGGPLSAYTAVARYTGGGYRTINEDLRNGVDPSDDQSATRYMDEAFDLYSARLTEPITVYRSMKLPKGGSPRTQFLQRMQPGMVFEDKGFSSTSVDYESTYHFRSTAGADPIMMVIEVPKGERVLAGHPPEKELILDRGRRMEVVAVDPPDKDGIPTVRLRVLQ